MSARAALLGESLAYALAGAIGWRIAVVLLPIEAIVPYIVQRRRNTWLGMLIHGAYNGSGFILVALGVIK